MKHVGKNGFFSYSAPPEAQKRTTDQLGSMSSSLYDIVSLTTVSGRRQIFVISCCCCNGATALTFHRPLYFMSAIKTDEGMGFEGAGGGKEKAEKKKSR